jgi:hypothetical protein
LEIGDGQHGDDAGRQLAPTRDARVISLGGSHYTASSFHFSFFICDLSFVIAGRQRAGAMTNVKSQMKNEKWKMLKTACHLDAPCASNFTHA